MSLYVVDWPRLFFDNSLYFVTQTKGMYLASTRASLVPSTLEKGGDYVVNIYIVYTQ